MDNFENTTPMILVAAAILLAVLGVVLLIIAKKKKPIDMDLMEGREFEFYCADLLQDSGFQNVRVTRESGDFGIDVLAEREGISYAIQCKRYSDLVGIKAVQEAYAGRDLYDCMVGVVMTNQYFSKPAIQAAQKLKILLWDRDYVQWMEDGCEDYTG